jgi:predicted transcriptional regulator
MSMISWAELQLAVMGVLWQNEHATVHEIIAALSGERAPAYTTILTVLTNLVKQGFVAHEPRSATRMFQYRALVTQRDLRADIVEDMIARLFDGSPVLLIKLLLETQHLAEQELVELRQTLCDSQPEISGSRK